MDEKLQEEGRALKFGNDISTDLITPGRYTHLRSNIQKLAEHVLEDADLIGSNAKFADVVQEGDFVVADRNFGLGSSREFAPAAMKAAGARAVLAQSFARIFFRNAINVGFPAFVCDTTRIEAGDRLFVDMERGVVRNLSQDTQISVDPLPAVMVKILESGGLVPYVVKNRGFTL